MRTSGERPRLSVVIDPPPPVEAPARAPEPAGREPTTTGSIAVAVRRDLDAVFSAHPAAGTLTELAGYLAELLDMPTTRLDGRTAAVLARELRATIGDLTSHEEAAEDDDLGGMPAPVGVSTA